MVGDILQPTHLMFVLLVALVVLGPKRLPEVARTLGNGIRDFRAALTGEHGDDDSDGHAASHEFELDDGASAKAPVAGAPPAPGAAVPAPDTPAASSDTTALPSDTAAPPSTAEPERPA